MLSSIIPGRLEGFAYTSGACLRRIYVSEPTDRFRMITRTGRVWGLGLRGSGGIKPSRSSMLLAPACASIGLIRLLHVFFFAMLHSRLR